MPDSNASFSEDRMTNETQSPRAGDGNLPPPDAVAGYLPPPDGYPFAKETFRISEWIRPQTEGHAWKLEFYSRATVERLLAAAPAAAPAGQGCKHRRYSLDKQEQVGHCIDCGAEGRMVFVANQAPATVARSE